MLYKYSIFGNRYHDPEGNSIIFVKKPCQLRGNLVVFRLFPPPLSDRYDTIMKPSAQQHKQFLIDCLNLRLHGVSSGDHVPQLNDDQWHGLEAQAEYHSVAPLLYQIIQQYGIKIPGEHLQKIKALVLRHRRANVIRFSCLREIALLFADNDIDLIALKGAALAHLLYEDPSLRPMNDMDLLVAPEKADTAAALLVRLGYQMPHGLHRFNHRPHHLPMLQKKVQGLTVTIELHRDTMHRDSPKSMTMDDLTESPQTFTCNNTPIRAMGHRDMLYHLCRHSFSASTELRLIHLYDIMSYATKFHDRIDWRKLGDQYPYVINGIRCVHCIFPCPDALAETVHPPVMPFPDRCGEAMRPLSKIVQKGRPWSTVFNELFRPSPWWKHAYYGIRPEDSLLACNWITHPAMIARWIFLRILSACYTGLHYKQNPEINNQETR